VSLDMTLVVTLDISPTVYILRQSGKDIHYKRFVFSLFFRYITIIV